MEQELSDPAMIKQAKRAFPQEVEPLYWILEDAIYDNNISRAQSIYNMFLYMARYSDVLVGLRKIQRDRLKQIAFELYGDKVTKQRESILIKQAVVPKKLPFKKEIKLQNYLLNNPSILEDALGDRIIDIDSEVETDFEYRCDLVAKNEVKFYPIELKIHQADHQVVSQIEKYCWFFYRKLRYDRYRDIQGVVCGAGFDEWSINELRRSGFWIFDIYPTKEGVRLVRIE